jgi:hypothetical protein
LAKFSTGQTSLGINIYAIDNGFFSFNDLPGLDIQNGEAAINEKLANQLELKLGDEVIIRYKGISSIPAYLPFAPENESSGSLVLKVGKILRSDQIGNFSLTISQITPLNVFVNRSDLESDNQAPKINRLLIENGSDISEAEVVDNLIEIGRKC